MEIDQFYLFLLLKMLVTGLIVAAAATAAERYGPLIGALIATLPVSVGPSYVFLALDHGPAFIGEAARGTLAINPATAVFITVYAYMAQRFSVVPSLLAAFLPYLGLASLVIAFQPGLLTVGVMTALSFALAMVLTRRFAHVPPAPRLPRQWWDIPLRMALAATIVAIVVLSASHVGPLASGLMAVAPVALTSIALILHPRLGGDQAACVLVKSLPGLVGFAFAVLAVHLLAEPLGSAAALLASLAISLLWNAGLLLKDRVVRSALA